MKETSLRKFAMTGDLILFKGQSIINKLQRVVTGSSFDHVGMIIRKNSKKLLLLEATGTAVKIL